MTYKLVPLFVAATLLSAAAMADDTKPVQGTDTTFKALDKNADARVSQSEAAADRTLATQFAALDTDSDGYLSMREYTAAHAKPDKSGRDYQ